MDDDDLLLLEMVVVVVVVVVVIGDRHAKIPFYHYGNKPNTSPVTLGCLLKMAKWMVVVVVVVIVVEVRGEARERERQDNLAGG